MPTKYFRPNGGSGTGIPTVASYLDLATLEPAAVGTKRIIPGGIPGSTTGDTLVVRGVRAWYVPGADSAGMAYVSAHPIPNSSPTTPGAWKIDGASHAIYGNNSSTVGELMINWGEGTATSCTTCCTLANTSGEAVNRVRLAFAASVPNTVDISAKLTLGTNYDSDAGPWTAVTFGGSQATNINWTSGATKYIWSDWITLPAELAPGEAISIWISGTGDSSSRIQMPNAFSASGWRDTSMGFTGKVSSGNGVAGETMNWHWFGANLGLVKIAWGLTDTSSTFVNIAAFGDSTISMYAPFGQPDYTANGTQGWAYTANKQAALSNHRFHITTLGEGGVGLAEYQSYVLAAIPGLVGMVDVITMQPWTSNSPATDATKASQIALTAQVKAACDAAGIAFMPLSICLPGAGNWNVDHYDDTLSAEELRCYDEVRAEIAATYPSFLDGVHSAGVADASGIHYNLADSDGDNHLYVSNATDKVGQYKIGVVVNNSMPAKLNALGYFLDPVPAATNRRIVGRSMSDGQTFGGVGNNIGFWAYNGEAVVTSRVSFSVRVYNRTGKSVARVAFPLMTTSSSAPGATVLGAWVGLNGTNQSPDSGGWNRMTIAGVNTYTPGTASSTEPDVELTDTMTLPAPLLPEQSCIFRIVYESTGEITAFDSLGINENNLSLLAQSWMSLSDNGSGAAELSAAANWMVWSAPMPHVFFEFSEGEEQEVSVMVAGDSVVNNFLSGNLNRDGWSYALEQRNTNKYHVAQCGGGGLTTRQTCQRTTAVLRKYKSYIDVLVVEAWSPNDGMAYQDITAQNKSDLTALKAVADADGITWAVCFIVPAGTDGAQSIATKNVMLDWCTTTYPGHVMNWLPGVSDPNNPERYLPANTVDDYHMTPAGNTACAAYMEPMFATMLTAFGYQVQPVVPVRPTPSTYSSSVSWNAKLNAVSYDVYYTKSGGVEQHWINTPLLTTIVTGLDSESTYSFRVLANVVDVVGTASTTTLTSAVIKTASLMQGTSSLAVSSDWSAYDGGSAIPAQGVTISFPLYNWFAAAQTPVNKASILLGNLTANAASGMRIAYCIGPHDYFKNNFAGDTQIDNYGFGDVVSADPTLGWVILPANACDIAAGAQETLRDTDWNTYTANESFLWVDLPFGQYLSEFTVYVRVFIPQFTTGQQYASAYRSSSQGTSFLVHQQALGSEAINDQYGIATRYRQKPGNYVASIQESSIAWSTTPDGWGAYDPPNVPTIPVLAIRWGT